MDLIELLKIILAAVKAYKATGANVTQLQETLNQATMLADEIQNEMHNKGMI